MKICMKKIGLFGIVFCCALLLFTACSKSGNAGAVSSNASVAGSNANVADQPYSVFQTVGDTQAGISIEVPNDKDGTLVKAYIQPNEFPANMQPKDGIEIDYFAPSFWAGNSSLSAEELQRQLLSVQYYDQTDWDGWIAAGKSISDITGVPTNKEIGSMDGMVYIYSEQNVYEGKLEGQDLDLYRAAVNLISKMRDSIKLIPRAASNMSAFPSIATKDINGKAVDNSVVSDNELTMINFWATSCVPCVDEMPDLQKLSAGMPEGTKLIGVVGDAADDQLISQAQKIANSKGVTYSNLIPDATLKEYIAKNIVAYPTTVFVDGKGNIIGDAIVGANNLEFYESELANRLKSLNNASDNPKTIGTNQSGSQSDSQGNDSPKVPGPVPAS